MKNSPDPSVHRRREQEIIQHVERLLADDRLRIDTIRGARAVTTMQRDVSRTDKAVDLKRLMSELNRPDRELQNSMPVGESLEVTLSQTRWWLFSQVVGRLRVVCVSPTKALLTGEAAPPPMTPADVQKLLGGMPPSLGGAPTTVVIASTSGFTTEARELADRRAERTVILAEPNDVGGWRVSGPPETRALVDLFDPEADADKRRRVREHIQAATTDLLGGGVSADRLAAKAQLPQQLVESELKAYAAEHAGLAAKRLDGRLVLFREGSSAPVAAAGAAASAASGGSDMPLFDRVKALFGRKGDDEKKISFLSERRAALCQQRDRSYEDMGVLEQQEADLRKQFKEATGSIPKRRITSQLLQLRKDIERRQQLLGVVNQQINVVSTHLHSLELVQQGKGAQLPSAEELTEDAVKAEEMLAELEASNELAGSSGPLTGGGMTTEEQALFEELERESAEAAAPTPEPTESTAAAGKSPDRPQREPAVQTQTASSGAAQQRRSDPEPG